MRRDFQALNKCAFRCP